jgi:hypothetical protein
MHPIICPVWPLVFLDEFIPAIAMPWFENGNVLDFTRQHPGVDKLAIVRLVPLWMVNIRLTLSIQVKQIVSAVAYIHAMDKVHGNIVPVCLHSISATV